MISASGCISNRPGRRATRDAEKWRISHSFLSRRARISLTPCMTNDLPNKISVSHACCRTSVMLQPSGTMGFGLIHSFPSLISPILNTLACSPNAARLQPTAARLQPTAARLQLIAGSTPFKRQHRTPFKRQRRRAMSDFWRDRVYDLDLDSFVGTTPSVSIRMDCASKNHRPSYSCSITNP